MTEGLHGIDSRTIIAHTGAAVNAKFGQQVTESVKPAMRNSTTKRQTRVEYDFERRQRLDSQPVQIYTALNENGLKSGRSRCFETELGRSPANSKRYYYAGDVRVAVRDGTTVMYLFGDHLGSTALTTNKSGGRQAELRYMPFGTTRYTYATTPTTFRYTGQRQQTNANELYFYGSRWYDPLVGRFVQPDTIVPDPMNSQSLNRYSYSNNNPLRYTDPSGHFSEDEIMKYLDASTWEDVLALFEEGKALAGRWGFLELLREAELGSRVQILDGWDYWSAGTVDDYTVGSGSVVERDGRLVLQAETSSMSITSAGQKGNAYYVEHANYPGGRQIFADVQYNGPRIRRDIDRVGVGFDLGGVLPTLSPSELPEGS